MNITDNKLQDIAADAATNPVAEEAMLESQLRALEDRLRELPADATSQRTKLELQISRTLVGLKRGEEAWPIGRKAFEAFLAAGDQEHAVDACDALFQAEQQGSLSALGQGIWLAVTYPVDPELTVAMLHHVIDETPNDSDGAAVAAATAAFIADMRATGKRRENLKFFTSQMLGNVARRHSQVETREQFDFWLSKLELDDPDKFLPRLRNVVDVLVQDDWWFDREALQADLPVN